MGDLFEPRGIGGWLIFPAISLFLTPIILITRFITDFIPIFTEGYWPILTTPGSEAYHLLWAPVIIYEIAGDLFFIAFCAYMVIPFFTKSAKLPKLFIIFLSANLVFIVSDTLFASQIPAVAQELDSSSGREIIRAISAAGIWIPYFLRSKRVKNTFVNKPEKESVELSDEVNLT